MTAVLELVARAWDGDDAALRELVVRDADGALAQEHRAGPALHAAADAAGTDGPAREPWHRLAVASAGRQMLLEATLDALADLLCDAGIPWMPIKGLDLCRRRAVYPRPEERPTSDVDVLIPAGRLDDARRAVLGGGWQALTTGRRAERYLRDEGYAWVCRDPNGVLVEIHFRLWAQVAPEVAATILADAAADATTDVRGRGRRPRLADAYLLAAVHAFTVPSPRGAGVWRDLTAIGRSAVGDALRALEDEIVERAVDFDLQLPVALAARTASALWDDPAGERIAGRLAAELRRPERRLFDALSPLEADAVALRRVVWARHLAGRRSRHGLLHAAWRRLWPHAGVVAAATESVAGRWPWPLRRLVFQWRHWTAPAR